VDAIRAQQHGRMVVEGVHTFAPSREALPPGYPDAGVTHSKGVRAHSRISRRNNRSPKEGEGTQSRGVSSANVSTHGESP